MRLVFLHPEETGKRTRCGDTENAEIAMSVS